MAGLFASQGRAPSVANTKSAGGTLIDYWISRIGADLVPDILNNISTIVGRNHDPTSMLTDNRLERVSRDCRT